MEKKEAMKILKDFHDKSALFSVRTALDTIIPELCESEDEKIRKAIIKLVRQSSEVLDKQNQNNMINWLEKQKEYESTDFEYVWNRTDCGALTSALDKYSEEAIINMCHAWYDKGVELERKSWLEKQGKETSEKEFTFKALPRLLEMIEVSDRAKAYTEKLAVALDNEGYHTDAKIVRESIKIMNGEEVPMATMDEQKPVDNIEPKFKVGDWIVWQNKCYKVNYNGCGYELIDQNGLSTSLEYGTVDKIAHLWTIQDAKDSDTLINKNYMGESPFIFKETKPSNIKTDVSNPLTIFGYCGIGGVGFTKSSGWGDTANCIYHPATKEQRDTLFLKMKEAGYEWSEETHELKKISQRMVSAEAKEALYDKPTDEEMKELLRTEYEKGRADTLSEMKSSWSEEDEVKINRIVACLENLNVADNDILLKDVDWLKSLKDRYTWKPSEEQIECLHDAINHYHTNGYPASKLNELYEQMSKIYKL